MTLARTALLALLLSGCGTTPMTDPTEKAAIAALDRYQAKHRVDDKGRVIDLTLESAQVDDAALEHVAAFTHLRRLSLYGAGITDAGLPRLASLGRLEELGLGDTGITDAGLPALRKMASLSHLWLSRDGRVTNEAVVRLKRELPGLVVHEQ